MARLTKKSPEYLYILYIIFLLVEYFGKLLKIDAGECPTEIPTQISEKKGITTLTFFFPKIIGEERGYTILKIQDILNDYLRIVLLPSQKYLQPYKNGHSIYDIIEPLYVDSVIEDETYMYIEVVYITSPLEYSYVREQEKIKF